MRSLERAITRKTTKDEACMIVSRMFCSSYYGDNEIGGEIHYPPPVGKSLAPLLKKCVELSLMNVTKRSHLSLCGKVGIDGNPKSHKHYAGMQNRVLRSCMQQPSHRDTIINHGMQFLDIALVFFGLWAHAFRELDIDVTWSRLWF